MSAAIAGGRRLMLSDRAAMPVVPETPGITMSWGKRTYLRKDIVRECVGCHEEKPMKARNLCTACYCRHDKAGTLDQFIRRTMPQPKVCIVCGDPEKRVETKGMCHTDYLASRRRAKGTPTRGTVQQAKMRTMIAKEVRAKAHVPLYETIPTERDVAPVPEGTLLRYNGDLYPHRKGELGTVTGGWAGGVYLQFMDRWRGIALMSETLPYGEATA